MIAELRVNNTNRSTRRTDIRPLLRRVALAMRPASVVGWRSDALSPTASNLFLRLSRILPTKTAGFLVAVFTNEDRMSLRLFCNSSPNIYALHDISLSYAHESEKALSLKTKVTGDKTTGKGPGVGANRQELYTRQQTKS